MPGEDRIFSKSELKKKYNTSIIDSYLWEKSRKKPCKHLGHLKLFSRAYCTKMHCSDRIDYISHKRQHQILYILKSISCKKKKKFKSLFIRLQNLYFPPFVCRTDLVFEKPFKVACKSTEEVHEQGSSFEIR